MKRFLKVFIISAATVAIIVAVLTLVNAFIARSLPELKIWHTTILNSEYRADDSKRPETFKGYLELEKKVFDELTKRVYSVIDNEDKTILNRYYEGSRTHPDLFNPNWNRSFEFVPNEIKGGILLIHGLTDSPYTMRQLGEIFKTQGLYVLGIRLPGHGTVPGALTTVLWEDWMNVAKLGVRHIKEKIKESQPLYLAGFSLGGTIAVKYTMDSLDSEKLTTPNKIFLLSPAIGITPMAMFAGWHKVLSHLSYFEKYKWLEIEPEYDPFRYHSFTKNAAYQIHKLTLKVRSQINNLKKSGRIQKLPPIMTFNSIVDSTVLTEATIYGLYNKLDVKGNELVLFDINRNPNFKAFIMPKCNVLLKKLIRHSNLPYHLTIISNSHNDLLEVDEQTRLARTDYRVIKPLKIAWPDGVYSLSHIAVPFSPDDPIYGKNRELAPPNFLHINSFNLRGENGFLRVSPYRLSRQRYNPFFSYIEKRLIKAVKTK